ncbi:MAG: type II secretion system F family protein [Candidatus Tritonobacter lacicola]|nr:type II secretion system F family protein [Candidatus Tritonobacter lacicola]
MAIFKYTAKNAIGEDIASTMVADSEAAVALQLRREGLTPVSIEMGKSKISLPKLSKGVKSDEIVVLSRQMATMVEAGLPLVTSLSTLQDQLTNPTLKRVITTVREDVEGGMSFSDALSRHPKIFSSLFTNLVRAGEASGMLAEILDRIASYMEATNSLKKKVRAAMIYPAVVSGMAILISVILIIKVIPVFGSIYEDFGAKLPLPTQILLDFSAFMQKWFLGIIVFFIAMGFLARGYLRTEKGRLAFDRFQFKLPIFGPLIQKVVVSRFARTLSTLIQSGVPILRAMDIVGKTAGNKAVELAVKVASEKIKMGESIADPLEETGLFPLMVTKMIAVGEKTGKLDTMLEKVSDFFDDQVDSAIAGLTSLIEPILIGFLGIVIGTIVVCMFMPILQLASVVSEF